MKDSGFTFIGDIPASWDIVRLNTVADLFGRIGWQGLTSDEYSDEGAWLVTGTDLVNGTVSWDSCVHVPDKRWVEAWQIQLKQGDVLITKDGTVGKVAVVDNLPGHSSLNSGVMRVARKGRGFDPHYLYYVLQSDVFKGWFEDVNAGASTIQHLFQGDFNHFVFPWPSLEEQAHISGFLSEATSALDNEMEILEQQISALERYKASLIHEAVTKGLDPSVPTKPSGVEWIGDIPEHWKTSKLKYLKKYFESGTSVRAAAYPAEGDEIGVLSLSAVFGAVFSPTANKKVDADELPRVSCRVRDGSLIVSRCNTSELVGTAAIVNGRYDNLYLPDKLWQIDFGSKGLNRFIYYSLLSQAARQYCAIMSVGSSSSMQNISAADFLNMFVVAPGSVEEQQAIADYLDKRCGKIDAILDIKHKQIDVLKCRRQSLIYEYVTGKRRVFQEA